MSEKAPQPNPDGNVSYDENNKRFRIRGENQSGAPFFAQDKILSHYGYADRTTEEAALATEQTPVDPMQDEVESTPTTTNTDIHPYTAYQQRIEDAEKLRSQADELLGSDEVKELRKSHLKSKASEKLKAGTWEARMSEAAPYFEVVMAAREKQAKDRSYEFNTEENEAADALAELNRKATLSAARSESKQDDPQKAMFEPLTEDDYRYYKATLEEGEDNEDSEDNQTTNHDPQDGKPWTQPDPATANKDLPKPPAKNNEDAAAQRKAQNEEDALDLPEPTIIQGINDIIYDIQNINPDDFNSKWAYDQEVEPLKDELIAQVNRLGLGGEKRAELVKDINKRLQATKDSQEQLTSDQSNRVETVSIDSSLIAAEQALNEEAKKLAIAQEELKKREAQEDAGQQTVDTSEWLPAMEFGKERAGKLQRVREALGKMSLKRTLEYLGLRERYTAPGSPKQADDQPRPNRRLSEVYGIDEAVNKPKKDRDPELNAALPERVRELLAQGKTDQVENLYHQLLDDLDSSDMSDDQRARLAENITNAINQARMEFPDESSVERTNTNNEEEFAEKVETFDKIFDQADKKLDDLNIRTQKRLNDAMEARGIKLDDEVMQGMQQLMRQNLKVVHDMAQEVGQAMPYGSEGYKQKARERWIKNISESQANAEQRAELMKQLDESIPPQQ